jgi:epoxyqueuosine reductase
VAGPLDSAFVKSAAAEAGFHKVGIARAGPLDPGTLDRMLARGAEADMAWLRTQRAARLDPSRLLPGVRSVVALALGYHAGEAAPKPPGAAEVARYARGRDYHAVMKRKLRHFLACLRARDAGARAFASSDIAPVMEKAWAERAGVGWIGKNGCLITTDLGSWVLLATVLLDRDLEPDSPHPERCGECAACLGACPTGAIPEPGLVDARLCLSFHTIERRGPIPRDIAERAGGWGFGCDDCQTVCPWNRNLLPSADPDLLPRPGQSALDLDEMLCLTLDRYRQRFWGTALARARYEGLVRNALLAAGNAGDPRRLGPVRAHLASEFPGVREAARWAAGRLGGGSSLRLHDPAMTLAERLAAARGRAAVGPVLMRGILRVTGKDRLDYLQRMCTQNLAGLAPGGAVYGAFLTAKGHLVGEGTVLARPEHLLLDVDPAAAAATRAHLEKFVVMDEVVLEDVSASLRVLPVFGPEGMALARGRDRPKAETARRGAPALDLYLEPEEAEALREALLARGAVSLGSADLEALRIEAGIPRFGADMDGERLPMEAGLTRAAVHFGKGCYIGQEVVLRATVRGHLQKGLVQLALPPGAGTGAKLLAGGAEVGWVTSAAETSQGRLGLGYLRRAHWKEGESLATAGGEAVVRKVIVHEGTC